MKLNFTMFLVLAALFYSTSALNAQDELYYADRSKGKIISVKLNGTDERTDVLAQSFIEYHVINFTNDKIYWTDYGRSVIARCNLDGTNQETLISDLDDPKGITVDADGNLIYIDDEEIIWTNSEGSNSKVLLSDLSDPQDVIFWDGLLYWTDRETDKIESIKLDGTGRTVVLSDLKNPSDIEINSVTSEIYWLQSAGSTTGSGVYRAQLDGTNAESVVSGFVNGLCVDGVSNFLYWSESINNTVNQYNLTDNTNKEFIGEYLPNPSSISIHTGNKKLYYCDNRYGGLIYEANLETGGSVKNLVLSNVYLPNRIEIDTLNKAIYWTNSKTSFFDDKRAEIMRSDMNGQNISRIVAYPEVINVEGLTLDVANNKMYWSDKSLNTIFRANLDGTSVENIVEDVNDVKGITTDQENKKLYWLNQGSKTIQRSDLDGSNVEDVISAANFEFVDIAIYNKESKLYWTEKGSVNRCNLDGSGVESLATIANPFFTHMNSIFIDEKNEKLYYSIDYSDERILRSDLDGSNVEDVITDDLKSARDIFLVYKKNSTSITPQESIAAISVYPNPSNQFFNITADFVFTNIKIYNNAGDLIYAKDKLNSTQCAVNAANFPNGIYQAVIYSGEKMQTVKLSKLN